MPARVVAIVILATLVTSCADPMPPASTELSARIGSVHRRVWANEDILSSGKTEEHLPRLEATLKKTAKRYGQHSVAMVQALTQTGNMLIVASGRYDLALPFIQRALVVSREVYGPEHRETAYALHDLAIAYGGADASEYDREAEMLLREALSIRLKLLGLNHEESAGAEADLARLLLNRWRATDTTDTSNSILEAEELALHARKVLEPMRGPTHYEIVSLRRTLLECAIARNDYPLAEARAREAIRLSDLTPASGLFPGSTTEELLGTIIAEANRQDRPVDVNAHRQDEAD